MNARAVYCLSMQKVDSRGILAQSVFGSRCATLLPLSMSASSGQLLETVNFDAFEIPTKMPLREQ